jgi:hypothetical protein
MLLLLVLLVAASVRPGAPQRSPEVKIGRDLDGSFVVQAAPGQDVLLNNVSFNALVLEVHALKVELAALLQPTMYAVAGTLKDGTMRYNGTGWQTAASLAHKREFARGAVFRKTAYATGGMDATSAQLVEAFDGTVWAAAPSMLQMRGQHCAVALDQYLYVIGGRTLQQALSSTERFDGIEWKPAQSLPNALYGMACATFRGQVVVVGGRTILAPFVSSVLSFNGAVWGAMPDMAIARREAAAAVFGNLLFVAGGLSSSTLQSVEIFDGTQWSAGPSLVTPRYSGGLVVYRNALIAIGGWADVASDGISAGAEQLSPNGTVWVRAPTMNLPHSNGFVLLL